MAKKHLLKPFSPHVVFSPHECREDKIDVMMARWCVNVAGDEFENFRNHLASPPEQSSDLAFSDGDGPPVHGWLFCRPETKGKNRHGLNIRKSRVLHPTNKRSFGLPLCGGFVRFGRPLKKAMPLYGGSKTASLTLSLNLQRFIRHQPKGDVPTDSKSSSPQRITARNDDRSKFGDERAYDGEDNWIPNTPDWQGFASPKASLAHLRNYLEKIARLFGGEMRRAARLATEAGAKGVHRYLDYLSFNVVETSWEFASESPLGDVLQIGNKLMHLRRKASATAYRLPSNSKLIGLGVAGRNLESPAFHIPLAENVELRLYAKTNRRIRFEVVQRGLWKQWSELLREADGIPGGKGGARSLDDALMIVKAIRQRAAGHLNKLMEQLRESGAEGLVCRSLVDLLAEIGAAMPEGINLDERARRIREALLLLCYQRGIRRSVNGGEFESHFAVLKKRGVIRYDRSRQFYVLTPEFAPAVEALEKVTGNPFTALFGQSANLRSFFRVGGRNIRERP